jgi:hypothetical protein
VLGKELGGGKGLTPGPFLVKKLGSEKLGTKLSKLNDLDCGVTMGVAIAFDVSTGVNVNWLGLLPNPKVRCAEAGVAKPAARHNAIIHTYVRMAFSPVRYVGPILG